MPHSPEHQTPKYIPFEPPTHLDCPICDRETDALKEFGVIETFFFMGIFAKWQMVTYTACPRCMRTYLLKRLLVNFFATNFLWPIMIVPPFLIQFARTFWRQHSRVLLQEYYDAYLLAMRRADWAEEDESPIDN